MWQKFLKNMIQSSSLGTDIALKWMPQNLTNEKSTMVQVMAWCRQATSHYLSQCWPRSMLPYDVTRPQWVNGGQPICDIICSVGDHHPLLSAATCLTHWGRVTHICISKLIIIGSVPGRCQAIIWTKSDIVLIGPLRTNFNEISITIYVFSFKKMHLKLTSKNWQPFFLRLNVITHGGWNKMAINS